MCGNCNCNRGSVFCLDERMIFIVLLIFLFSNCGNGMLGGLLGGGSGCGCGCGCDSCSGFGGCQRDCGC